MKLKIAKLALAGILALGMTGCSQGNTTVSPTDEPSITVSTKELQMDIGEYVTLGVELYKLEGEVTWTSANNDVVMIIDGDTLYGIGVGSTVVTATCGDASASVSVIVESDVIIPQFGMLLSLSDYRVDLAVNETKEISAWLEDVNGSGQITDITLKYVSSDSETVSVTEGVLTAKKAGNALVYVSTEYEGETYINSITVCVTE